MPISLLLLGVATCGAVAAGFAMGIPWALPLLCGGVAYPFYALNLARRQPGRAVLLMIAWAVALSLAVTLVSMAFPDRAGRVIWKGQTYTAEMMHWVQTGVGPEGTPSLFLPQHAAHFAFFNAACLASAGLGGLCMGAALLNYMNFYVASLTMQASRPLLAASLAWPPWAILRVLGFILASVPLSAAVMSRFRFWRSGPRISYWRYYLWGAALVVADAILKAVLAPYWRQFLGGAL